MISVKLYLIIIHTKFNFNFPGIFFIIFPHQRPFIFEFHFFHWGRFHKVELLRHYFAFHVVSQWLVACLFEIFFVIFFWGTKENEKLSDEVTLKQTQRNGWSGAGKNTATRREDVYPSLRVGWTGNNFSELSSEKVKAQIFVCLAFPRAVEK